MTLIKTFQEMNDDLTKLAANAAISQFGPSIRPIYGATSNGLATHIGSCFFVEINGKTYLTTAAHIIDENIYTKLYVAIGRELQELSGTFDSTVRPNGRRQDDHYDFAWQSIQTWAPSQVSLVRPIKTKDIAYQNASASSPICIAIGYPNSKNKKHDHVRHIIEPRPHRFASDTFTSQELCARLGVTGEDHIFLRRHPTRAKDFSGRIVTPVALEGMSGGAVIDMRSVASVEAFRTGHIPAGKLVGIIIETARPERALVAVNMVVVRSAITSNAA